MGCRGFLRQPFFCVQRLKIRADCGIIGNPQQKNITVLALVERYLKTKTGTKPQTKSNYRFVVNILKNEPFSGKKIGAIKTSDAKLFLIKLQSDGSIPRQQKCRRLLNSRSLRWQRKPILDIFVDIFTGDWSRVWDGIIKSAIKYR